MIYEIKETGELIKGSSPIEVVENLKATGRFVYFQSSDEYLQKSAMRYSEYYGATVRHDTVENYLADLESVGHLHRIL